MKSGNWQNRHKRFCTARSAGPVKDGYQEDTRKRIGGAVVQLVRIPACHAGGRGFEPRPFRHLFKLCLLILAGIILSVI